MKPGTADRDVERLAAFLRRRPATAAEIAAELQCARPTAYVRIRQLIARGARIYRLPAEPTSTPGPRPVIYGLQG